MHESHLAPIGRCQRLRRRWSKQTGLPYGPWRRCKRPAMHIKDVLGVRVRMCGRCVNP